PPPPPVPTPPPAPLSVVREALPVPPAWYMAPPLVVIGRIFYGLLALVHWVVEWICGLLLLVVGLAVLASLPVLNFLSLGYLLEASGRVARTGRLSAGFPGVRLAAHFGAAIGMCYLFLVPVRLVSSLAHSAYVIDPGGPAARGWRLALIVLIGVTSLHLLATLARGGKLRYFLWPLNILWLVRRIWRGGYYTEARDAVWDYVQRLQLPYLFWLGVRGFAVALLWLGVPVTLLVAGHAPFPLMPLLGWLGTVLLAVVLIYLPFAQARLAETGRFAAAFELSKIREAYRHAPWAFTLALYATLLLAVPLYLVKIEPVPREVAWLLSLVLIVFVYPARLLSGWAIACAHARRQWAHGFFRWSGRLAMIPVVLFYLLILYFAQYVSWNGIWSFYEQHAFTLPVPILGT
ncbi:MAG: DUF4013 domain-containing protein, partial [Gemmataceae bacterium]